MEITSFSRTIDCNSFGICSLIFIESKRESNQVYHIKSRRFCSIECLRLPRIYVPLPFTKTMSFVHGTTNERMYRFEVETVHHGRETNPRWPFAPLGLKLSTPRDTPEKGTRNSLQTSQARHPLFLERAFRIPPRELEVYRRNDERSMVHVRHRSIPWNEKLSFERIPASVIHPSAVNVRVKIVARPFWVSQWMNKWIRERVSK